ncbi:hypothetical protein FQA39_LY10758 [Lamprigera yunnana]|nr:hypothetical protein FQA39_LY10758 [Lamprigera yunnana]
MTHSNVSIPSLEQALADLKAHQEEYLKVSTEVKVKTCEMEKLNHQQLVLKSSLDESKKIIEHYKNALTETSNKINTIIINQNNAKLLDMRNKHRFQQTEKISKTKNRQFRTYDTQMNTPKYMHIKKGLLVQKLQLEDSINANNLKIEALKNYLKNNNRV